MLARLKAWIRKLVAEPVLEPVPEKLIKFPKAYSGGEPLSNSTAEPVPPGAEPSEPVREPVPKLVPEPDPLAQARALLGWLQERYGGHDIQASQVEIICYSQLLEEMGWRGRPWVGRHGVGKYLTALTGGKKLHRYWEDEHGNKERVRIYRIPRAAATRKRA